MALNVVFYAGEHDCIVKKKKKKTDNYPDLCLSLKHSNTIMQKLKEYTQKSRGKIHVATYMYMQN